MTKNEQKKSDSESYGFSENTTIDALMSKLAQLADKWRATEERFLVNEYQDTLIMLAEYGFRDKLPVELKLPDIYLPDEYTDLFDDNTDKELYHEAWMARCACDLEKACELFLKSLELRNHSATHRELYITLLQLGNEEEAFPHIEQAYILNPKELKGVTLYAEALYRRGKIEEAKVILDKALQQSKTFGPARKLLEKIKQETS